MPRIYIGYCLLAASNDLRSTPDASTNADGRFFNLKGSARILNGIAINGKMIMYVSVSRTAAWMLPRRRSTHFQPAQIFFIAVKDSHFGRQY
jgi:hypothetical protein